MEEQRGIDLLFINPYQRLQELERKESILREELRPRNYGIVHLTPEEREQALMRAMRYTPKPARKGAFKKKLTKKQRRKQNGNTK